MADSVSAVTSLEVPRAANADTTSTEHLLSACQHVSFPLPANRPVWSAPVKAWKPGNATVFVIPSACTIGASGICHFLFLTPVMNYVFLHS